MTLDEIELPDDLLWVDEFEYTPVRQNIEPTLTGAIVVESAALQKGRPITLQGTETTGWVTRSTVLVLQTKSFEPGLEMILTLVDRRSFNVIFRHQDAPPLVASQLYQLENPTTEHYYILNSLKLMEI